MIFERLPEPFSALIIKNTFNEKELSNILNEIKPFTAKAQEANGAWLLDIYKDLDVSPTHYNSMETIFTSQVAENFISINSVCGLFNMINNHSTQIKYYGHCQSSMLHFDCAAFSVVTFLFDEPKNFDGGNFTLQINSDIAYEQDIENNMTVIYPSSYYFALSEVNINNKDIDNSGLYTINSYCFIESR